VLAGIEIVGICGWGKIFRYVTLLARGTVASLVRLLPSCLARVQGLGAKVSFRLRAHPDIGAAGPCDPLAIIRRRSR
jgi:hypothetical protein